MIEARTDDASLAWLSFLEDGIAAKGWIYATFQSREEVPGGYMASAEWNISLITRQAPREARMSQDGFATFDAAADFLQREYGITVERLNPGPTIVRDGFCNLPIAAGERMHEGLRPRKREAHLSYNPGTRTHLAFAVEWDRNGNARAMRSEAGFPTQAEAIADLATIGIVYPETGYFIERY